MLFAERVETKHLQNLLRSLVLCPHRPFKLTICSKAPTHPGQSWSVEGVLEQGGGARGSHQALPDPTPTVPPSDQASPRHYTSGLLPKPTPRASQWPEKRPSAQIHPAESINTGDLTAPGLQQEGWRGEGGRVSTL